MLTRFVLGATLVLSLTIIAPAAYGGPAAAVDETAFDFGFVPRQAKISHVFTIRSVGDDTLRIVQVIPGCGCTKAPLEKSELAPGESTTLEVVFSTGAYTGRVVKLPKFVTNEASPNHPLEFLSHVLVRPDSSFPVIVQPPVLDFSGTDAGAPKAITFRLVNATDTPLSPKLVDAPADFLEVSLPESIPAGGSAEATVLLKSTERASFEKSFTFQLDDSRTSRFTVPVKKTSPAAAETASSLGH